MATFWAAQERTDPIILHCTQWTRLAWHTSKPQDKANHRPEYTANHDRIFTTQYIRDIAGDQSTQPRASGHGSSNTTLPQRVRTRTCPIFIRRRTKVAFVGVGVQNGRHRRDIETKQTATDNGDACNHIDVADDHDGGWQDPRPVMVEQPKRKKRKKNPGKQEERKKKRRETGEKEEGRQKYLKQPPGDKERESSTILPADQQTRANSRLPPGPFFHFLFPDAQRHSGKERMCSQTACRVPASLTVHDALCCLPAVLCLCVLLVPVALKLILSWLIQPPGHVPPGLRIHLFLPHGSIAERRALVGPRPAEWALGRSRAPAPASGFRIGASAGVSLSPCRALAGSVWTTTGGWQMSPGRPIYWNRLYARPRVC